MPMIPLEAEKLNGVAAAATHLTINHDEGLAVVDQLLIARSRVVPKRMPLLNQNQNNPYKTA